MYTILSAVIIRGVKEFLPMFSESLDILTKLYVGYTSVTT